MTVAVACARNTKLAIVNVVVKEEPNVLLNGEPFSLATKNGIAVIMAIQQVC